MKQLLCILAFGLALAGCKPTNESPAQRQTHPPTPSPPPQPTLSPLEERIQRIEQGLPSIGDAGQVDLAVYNLLGQEIKVITNSFVNITVDRGGAQGGIRGVNLALWESDGTTEIECNRYVSVNDDVVVGYTNLTVGNWYYISVDNYASSYRGPFTLCVDNTVDYDYYEGAIIVPQ